MNSHDIFCGCDKCRVLSEEFHSEQMIEWIKSNKPAVTSFTAGPQRQIAYHIEPLKQEIQSLRAKLTAFRGLVAVMAEGLNSLGPASLHLYQRTWLDKANELLNR